MEDRKYISAGEKYCTRVSHVNAPVLRKKFFYKPNGKKVTAEISVAGFYRLFVNGVDITKGYFAPAITNPDDIIYYDEYDLTDIIRAKNVVCVLLGNGFNNAMDGGIWDFESAAFRSAPKLFLKIYDEDGVILTSDDTFRAVPSAITFDDLRAGERYDARLEKDDILSFDFADEEKYPFAVYAKTPKGEYTKCEDLPVKTFEEISAVGIYKTEDGYVYDFGKDIAAVYRLNICGESGQTLDLYFGELFSRGKFDISTVMNDNKPIDYVQHDQYVLKCGKQTYSPTFTYHGYRYVLIKGLEKSQATADLITAVVIHSDFAVSGTFSCDNETVNKIQECTIRSDLSNLVSIPTDCPQREKNGWTADAALSTEQFYYNFDCRKVLECWHKTLCAAQKESGELPGIAPTAGWGFAWGNGPAWDSALIEIPYRTYKFYGDKRPIAACFDKIERYYDYLKTKKNQDGLYAFGLGDWCETGSKLGEAPSTPLEVTDSLCVVEFAKKAAFLANEIGKTEAAKVFNQLREETIFSFRKKWIKNSRVVCDTQTAQAFAIHAGVFNSEEVYGARLYLKELIEKNGGKFHVGVIGARYIFDELAKAGFAKTAYNSIVADGFPSYKYWVDHGATALWERFYLLKEEPDTLERVDGEGILSMNHHFWGHVSAWFYKYIGGLKIKSRGVVEISPETELGISRARCSRADKNGAVLVEWERINGNEVRLSVGNSGFSGKIKINGYVFSDGEKEKNLPQGKNEWVLTKIRFAASNITAK